MDKITIKKLERYIQLTGEALQDIKVTINKEFDCIKAAKDILEMAKRYYKDAKYYKDKNDFVTAFAAINYAHGWLDAGVKIGVFKVTKKELFCIDK